MMTANVTRKISVKRAGMRWGLRAKSAAARCSDARVSYCCKTGKHGIQCASLGCGCWCH